MPEDKKIVHTDSTSVNVTLQFFFKHKWITVYNNRKVDNLTCLVATDKHILSAKHNPFN